MGKTSFKNLLDGKEDTHKLDTSGFLVEYLNSPTDTFKHLGYDNYISWSPSNVFEQSYLKSENIHADTVINAIREANGEIDTLILTPFDTDKDGNPTVTKEGINLKIIDEKYDNPRGTTLTRCILTLENGFTVTGESASASKAKFNEEIGKRIARDQAIDKIWVLEGYLLKEKLYRMSYQENI
ncbi:MAG TPA: hypothetical protein EYG75_03085 [Campylobacterales bacterium]|nr:hypothetical protein [Campylobacterales bacterium]